LCSVLTFQLCAYTWDSHKVYYGIFYGDVSLDKPIGI
jgi:hypothetical protein